MAFLGVLIILVGVLLARLAHQTKDVHEDDSTCQSIYKAYKVICRDKLNDTSDTFEDFMRLMRKTYYTCIILAPIAICGGFLMIIL